MKRIMELLNQMKKSLENTLDLDSYRKLCLDLSLLINYIELQKKIAYKKGVYDSQKLLNNHLSTLTA